MYPSDFRIDLIIAGSATEPLKKTSGMVALSKSIFDSDELTLQKHPNTALPVAEMMEVENQFLSRPTQLIQNRTLYRHAEPEDFYVLEYATNINFGPSNEIYMKHSNSLSLSSFSENRLFGQLLDPSDLLLHFSLMLAMICIVLIWVFISLVHTCIYDR